jgi:hypothetical protein
MSTNEGVSLTIERGVSLSVQRAFVTVTVHPSGVPGPAGGGGGSLPPGGATGTFLRKKSSTNGDADWDNVDDGYF